MSIYDVLELDASMIADPKIYIDASYAANADNKSQSGLVMYFEISISSIRWIYINFRIGYHDLTTNERSNDIDN